MSAALGTLTDFAIPWVTLALVWMLGLHTAAIWLGGGYIVAAVFVAGYIFASERRRAAGDPE